MDIDHEITSISYIFEVVDFSIKKEFDFAYYPALNVTLMLTIKSNFSKGDNPLCIRIPGKYFNSPALTTSKEALKSRIHSITSISSLNEKISTSWDIEGNGINKTLKILLFTSEPPILRTVGTSPITETISLTIKYYTFCPSQSKKLYKYNTHTPRWLRNIKYHKEHQRSMKDFMIPVIDCPTTQTINFKFIAANGWKFEFPYAYKHKKENPVLLLLLEDRDAEENNREEGNRLVLYGLDEEDMFKDGDEKTLLSHHWEFTETMKSTWILSIHKENFFKEISSLLPYYKGRKYLYPPNNSDNKKIKVDPFMQKWNEERTNIHSYLIEAINFKQYAGSKNFLTAYGSYMLIILSFIFTVVFITTLFYPREKGIDYMNSIFAIIGLITVLLAYFFSYKTQRDNGTRFCISDDRIQKNITIATVLAILCAVILLGFKLKTFIPV